LSQAQEPVSRKLMLPNEEKRPVPLDLQLMLVYSLPMLIN
jgi:hypothetical protein